MEQLRKPRIQDHLERYVSRWTMKDGTQVTIRPIRQEDEPLMVKFHESLSERSVHLRYFSSFSLSARTAPERLLRVCFLDYEREMVLVADHGDANSRAHEILGVGRLTKLHGTNDAEVAVLITDRYQNLGLGAELLRRLIQVAREEGLDRIMAEMLQENMAMKTIAKKLGFQPITSDDPTIIKAVLNLQST